MTPARHSSDSGAKLGSRIPLVLLIRQSLSGTISRNSTWGRVTARVSEERNLAEFPLWRWIASAHQGEAGRNLALMTCRRGNVHFFPWTRKKGGLAIPVFLFWVSNAHACCYAYYQHHIMVVLSMASFSSPVCNVHSTGRRTWCSSRRMILVLIPVLVSFSLDIAGAHVMIYMHFEDTYMYFEDMCTHTSSYVLVLAQLVPLSEIFIFAQSSITKIPLNECTVW